MWDSSKCVCVTQCGGGHNDEVRTFNSILVKLRQECYGLDSFAQTLIGE